MFQQVLQMQVSLCAQQLMEHAHKLTFLHTHSDAALAKYMNKVCSAQSCTNCTLLDTQQMLQDIDWMIADSHASLGLPLLLIATTPTVPNISLHLPCLS